MPMKLVKIYLEPGQKPPKGVKVQRGPKGGIYFMGTPSQKKAHEKPNAAPKEKPKVNIFDKPKDDVKYDFRKIKMGHDERESKAYFTKYKTADELKDFIAKAINIPANHPANIKKSKYTQNAVKWAKEVLKQKEQSDNHPHAQQDREFQSVVKSNAPKNIKGLHAGHLITVDHVPGAEYRVMGSLKTKNGKQYLPVKVVKHKDQNRVGQMYDAPVSPSLKFQVIGFDTNQTEKQQIERAKLIKQLNSTQDALDKYEMSRKDSASQLHPGGHSYADPKVVKKYQDKIKDIMNKLDKLRRESIVPDKNELIRERIRQEIKKVLNESVYTQKDLINAFKTKPKDKDLMIFLKHSRKHRNIELVIHDLDQITDDKMYGFGTNQDGDQVEFKFSDVDKIHFI